MSLNTFAAIRWTFAWGIGLTVLGCGGGGGGSDTGLGEYTGPLPFEEAPLVASASVADACTDLRQKQFVRSYLDEVYLWPEQVQRRHPLDYSDVHDYFDAIVAPPPLDRFSFSQSVEDADQQEASEAFDVGILWRNAGTSSAPIWRVARVEPGSPADLEGVRRGDTLVNFTTNLNDAAAVAPYYLNITYRRTGLPGVYAANMTLRVIEEDPVGTYRAINADGRQVGYVAFESHYGDAQDQLINAALEAQALGIQDLVVDLRYNGGGFLYLAASLASMIAPTTEVARQRDFVRFIPNARRQAAGPTSAVPFSPEVWYAPQGAQYRAGTTMPRLNLSRVYVLTTGSTCSASESLINGLRGVGMTVHVIGNTTCGKPYGMVRQDNCGDAFYPIEFRGVNALGQANFTTGFAPTCQVADDLDHERGDPNEAMLAAALTHIRTGSCPASVQSVDINAALTQMAPTPRGPALAPPQRKRPDLALIESR